MGPRLTCTVSDIGEYCSEQNASSLNGTENAPRFIYYNKTNLAFKSTIHLDNRQTGNIACPKELLKMAAEMNERKSTLDYAGDIIVKTINDHWVVARISNLREFYVAVQQKNANLNDINGKLLQFEKYILHSLEKIL